MTNLPYLQPSNEAEWTGLDRVWASIELYPPRKSRPVSGWWMVLIGLVVIGLALKAGL